MSHALEMRLTSLAGFWIAMIASLALLAGPIGEASPRKVVLIAGPITGHPRDAHEYERSVILLKELLDTSPGLKGLRTEIHFGGWPQDEATLEDADTIVLVSDGGDHKETDQPLYVGNRLLVLEKQIRRGCGLVNLHWSTFHPTRFHDRITEWIGGYFDYETGAGQPPWFSKIETGQWSVGVESKLHPILRGVRPFDLQEEFYYRIRFRDRDARLIPLLSIPRGTGNERLVAWAVERADGGRGVGFTGGHFFENWRNPDFRKFVLNAMVWSARAEVPQDGVESTFGEPWRALIVTGHNHPAHDWRAVTAALIPTLEQDPRARIEITEKPEELAAPDLQKYQVLVLNYCNWDRPGLSREAREGLLRYLDGGGGISVIHFANGAFNKTLPGTESDWEEYRTRIVRRVWMHGEGRSGHDAFGPFRVEIREPRDPVTVGLEPFETLDELYFKQEGSEPIRVLATARSRVTNADEPMAWTYLERRGRVFQTVLGHSDESIRRAAALIRRGTTWAAGKQILSFDPPTGTLDKYLFRQGASWSPAASKAKEKESGANVPKGARTVSDAPVLVEGRFGRALDGKVGSVVTAAAELIRPPITVESWVKLRSRSGFNIIAACEPKTSSEHWEIYSYAGSGFFSVYLPGAEPSEMQSRSDICDGAWHHVGLVKEPGRVRLYVDAKLALDQTISRRSGSQAPSEPVRLGLGRLVEGTIACDGVVDELRVRRGAQSIDSVPLKPLETDGATLGLWQFDEPGELEPPRKSSSVLPPTPGIDGGVGGHWGVKNDDDWADSRWALTDLGPFLTSSLETPAGTVPRAISIRIGKDKGAAVCFDADALTLRAGWVGPFLTLGSKRFGLTEMPRIPSATAFDSPAGECWTDAAGASLAKRYRGLRLSGDRVVLEYEVDGIRVRESPWLESAGGASVFLRTLEIGGSSRELRLRLLQARPEAERIVRWRGEDGPSMEERGDGEIVLHVPPHGDELHGQVLIVAGRPEELKRAGPELARLEPIQSLVNLSKPGPRRWGEPLETRGELGSGAGPYVIDTLTIPHENPHRALLFLSGHDFFFDGSAAVATVHGDVWLVRGISAGLERLTWQRFATGLYQPLGLRIVGDVVHVLGRDQITRLRDLNGDGEADEYECFNPAPATSSGRHDFSTCLETDAAGNFYYVSPKGLHKVASDGSSSEVMATGWRNPNGLGVGPDGTITVAPQEGEWTPASQISLVMPGGYYGYPGPRQSQERPLGYDPPLAYIPRNIDNSTGGQVWVEGDRWGPLAGQLLSLSFGRSSFQLVLRDHAARVAQGGVVPLKGRFLSGVMRGRFRPADGQLYVTGLMGWVTNAVLDGCFQRVRFTGSKVYLPSGFEARRNGLRLDFTEPLERGTAEDARNYSAEAWNYRYAGSYGSEEFSAAHPGEVGHDRVLISAAYWLEGGRSVFLEMPALRPVHQMRLRGLLRATDGTDFSFDFYPTIHELGPELDVSGLEAAGDPSEDPVPEVSRPRGLALTLTGAATGRSDARVARMASIRVPRGASPSAFLEPGSFRATWSGFLNIAESGRFRFSLSGRGSSRLTIDGSPAHECAGEALESSESPWLRLRRGAHAFQLEYESAASGDSWARLYWQGRDFARETIPPQLFTHEPSTAHLAEGNLLRRGRELVAELRCLKCHALERDGREEPALTGELDTDAPTFDGIGDRLEPGWMAEWIAAPRGLRPSARMPAFFGKSSDGDASLKGDRRPWDLAAYLATLKSVGPAAEPSSHEPRPDDAGAARGGELFARFGCIACHLLPNDARVADDEGRLGLSHSRSKWRPGALAEFLARPSRHFRSTRMPDFKLTAEEASGLASFLLAASAASPEAPAVVGVARTGASLVLELGCLSCHALSGQAPARSTAPTLAEISGVDWALAGCASEARTRNAAPHYALDESDRMALRDFGRRGLPSLARSDLVDLSRRQINSLRCGACHERDGVEPAWARLKGETDSIASRAPSPITVQSRPSITFAGEQLENGWLAGLLTGQLGYTLRPWLDARMPCFPAQGEALARGLALEHGVSIEPEPAMPSSADAAKIGSRLLGTAGGLSCVTCHSVGDQKAQMQLHFGVINLLQARERLRHEHFLRWMLSPQRLSPLTTMPGYADEDGRSALAGVLSGDARRQFEAIWNYLSSAR